MRLPSMEDIAAPTPATPDTDKITYWQMSRLVARLEADNAKLRRIIREHTNEDGTDCTQSSD